jgi:hypothetical protein
MFGFFRPRPTVDSIMAGFIEAIDQLDQLQHDKMTEKEGWRQQVLKMEQAMDAAGDEANRAASVRAKLALIVGKDLDDEIPF